MRDGRECVPPMYRLLYNPWGVHITVTEIHVRHTSLYCYIIIFLSSFTFSFGHTAANSTKGFDAKWIGVMVPLYILPSPTARTTIDRECHGTLRGKKGTPKSHQDYGMTYLIYPNCRIGFSQSKSIRRENIIAENWILPHENVLGKTMSTESVVHRGQW